MPSSLISHARRAPPHAAGGHGCAVYSSSVTDAQWAILEPLLPAPGSTAGRIRLHDARHTCGTLMHLEHNVPVGWPPIWTRNTVEPMRTSGTGRDSLDG